MISKCKLLVGQDLNRTMEFYHQYEQKQFSLAFTASVANLDEKIELLPYPVIEIVNFITGEETIIDNLNFYRWKGVTEIHNLQAEPKLIFHSSGSSEGFKWIFLRKDQAQFAGKTIADHLELKATDHLAITAPLFHTFGFNIGILGCLEAHCSFTHFSTIAKSDWVNEILNDQYTHIYAVPTIMQDLKNALQVSNSKLKKLRGGIIGGAKVDKELFDYFFYDQNVSELTVGYGMTESSPIVTHSNPGEGIETSGDIGNILPGLEFKIQEQELIIKGYQVTEFITKKSFGELKLDKPNWYRTGDYVSHENGRLIYLGRKSQTIERGGEKINVEALEKILKAECLARGIEQNFVCFKATSEDSRFSDQIGIALEGQSQEDVQKILKSKIIKTYGNFFREIKFIHVDNLPYGDTGKVLRQEQQLTERRMAS